MMNYVWRRMMDNLTMVNYLPMSRRTRRLKLKKLIIILSCSSFVFSPANFGPPKLYYYVIVGGCYWKLYCFKKYNWYLTLYYSPLLHHISLIPMINWFLLYIFMSVYVCFDIGYVKHGLYCISSISNYSI